MLRLLIVAQVWVALSLLSAPLLGSALHRASRASELVRPMVAPRRRTVRLSR